MSYFKVPFYVFFAMLISVTSVYAEEEELLSGEELLQRCDEGSIPGEPNEYCMQYVFGLAGHIMVQQQMEGSKPIFCIDPNSVTPPMVVEDVVAYIRSNGDRGKEPAQTLATEGLIKNYPCGF